MKKTFLLISFLTALGWANPAPTEPQKLPENLYFCQVQVGYGQMVSGNRCFLNQVMVGVYNGYLLCAAVQVNCYYRDIKEERGK